MMYRWSPVSCATEPIVPSFVGATLFSAIDMAQGRRPTPSTFGLYAGGIYVYNLLQCPMEAMNGGRPSAWHNIASGSILGYVGVRQRVIGVPFVDPYFFYRHPQLAPEIVAAAVYGGIAGALTMLSGKPF